MRGCAPPHNIVCLFYKQRLSTTIHDKGVAAPRDLHGAALVAVRVVVAKKSCLVVLSRCIRKGCGALPRVADAADVPRMAQMFGLSFAAA